MINDQKPHLYELNDIISNNSHRLCASSIINPQYACQITQWKTENFYRFHPKAMANF